MLDAEDLLEHGLLEPLLAAVEDHGVALWFWHDNPPRFWCSQSVRTLFRVVEPPSDPENFFLLVYPDDRAQIAQIIYQNLPNFRLRYRLAASPLQWIQTVVRRRPDPDGRSSMLVGISTDVTLEVLHEQVNQLLVEVGSVAKIGGWSLDLATRTMEWTEQTRVMHEAPPKFRPTIAEAASFYVEGKSREGITTAIRRAMHEGIAFDGIYDIRTYMGNPRSVRAVGRPEIRNGKVVRVYGAFQDVTNEVRANQTLRTLAQGRGGEGHDLIKQASKAILDLVGADEAYVCQSQADGSFVTLASWCQGEYSHDPIVCAPYDSHCNIVIQHGQYHVESRTNGAPHNRQNPHDNRENGYFGIVVHDSGGKAVGTFSLVSYNPLPLNSGAIDLIRIAGSRIGVEIERLIKEGKQVEYTAELESRVAARTTELEQLNRELESFTYSVSHDLRSPLRHMAGYAAIIQESEAARSDPDIQDAAKRVILASKRMGNLIDDLLDFAKSSRLELVKRQTPMGPVVRECIDEIVLQTRRDNIEWQVEPLPDAFLDPNLLRIVWLNLIDNAVKYSSGRAAPVIKIGSQRLEDCLRFEISDNGAGFDMQFYGQLFGVFSRLHTVREFEGLGIGLATIKRVIERHGGEVGAKGEVNVGATFWFTLPLG
ncbi:MAG: ATP-binding protein [Fimbriimonas sp.]